MNRIEENILVENKNWKFVFSMDYEEDVLFINIFDKRRRETIVSNYPVVKDKMIETIFANINRYPGSLLKKSNMRFIIRNHDIVLNDNGIIRNIVSDKSVYDSRFNSEVPFMSKVIPYLKEAWVKI